MGRSIGCVACFLALVFVLAEGANGASQYAALAEKYAPYIKFDSKAGLDDHCFPHNAGDYYAKRLSGDTSRQCNLDYSSLYTGAAPTYWHAAVCGYHLHIAYWSFYGYNHDCDCCSGERDAFWNSVVIKIRDWDLDAHLHEVRFSQKEGWYTRVPGRYEIFEDTHPVAYVGKSSHGSYHDDGGSGTCCYYEDFRNPGDPNQFQKSWLALVELDNSTAWMSDPDTNVWNGIQSPLFRSDRDLCALNGCTGSSLQLCLTTCGCSKSDTDDMPF